MLRKDLAHALGISAGMVTRLAQRGMPCDTVDSARRWRERHLEPARTKFNRAPSMPRRTTDDGQADIDAAETLRQVTDLSAAAHALLPLGQFAAIEPALRRALRSVPTEYRGDLMVGMPGDPEAPGEPNDPNPPFIALAVWEALLEPILTEARAEQAGLGEARRAMTAAERDEMGRFWYAVAAGEIAATEPHSTGDT